MNEAVFNTEAEALARQALDLADHLAIHTDEPYASQTTSWAAPRQRIDGKWCYPCCEHSNYDGLTVELFNEANYTDL